MDLPVLLVLVSLSVLVFVQATRRRRMRLPYPPGPPADPLIGHLRMMPDSDVAPEVFHGWAKQYGDVMSLNVLGKPLLILSSEEAAMDLLDKRSLTYSDRPSFPMLERLGWKDVLVFVPYGQYFKKLRKMIQVPFEKEKVSTFRSIEEQEACVLLYNLLNDPVGMDRYVHRYSSAIILEISYGHRVLSNDDEYFKAAEIILHVLHDVSRPSLLDVSPIFEKLPAWFPGAWFVKYIRETKPVVLHNIQMPVADVQKQLVAGTAKQSFVSQHLEDLTREGQLTPESLYDLSMVAHMIFGGGSETSWHTIMTFIACMLTNPDIQRKAQEEIDRVVGNSRLPDFTDRDSLPYIECIAQETMRWHPVAPLGVPHKATEDDEYRGMYIPKGTTIMANARSITWDERHFHDPLTFKPERFLPKPEGAGEVFPQGGIFGWGRRICPGRYLADNMVWIAVVNILAAFDVRKTKDADGNIIEPQIEFITSITSHPKPFLCDLKPRSENAAKLIRQAYDMHMANVATS
ncbi:uncharacterized protein PHACADRAFT_195823 [Phanerochaete carnosa HHB-10118-sp]|uniref:Cytochrome P450 n=1 Tax=Phanerochaete carnosa (strain HHB-10118-sp) TaxID=650164 RepID=K5UZZ6_PHACS|nr:uncharacterized protein PHACADRAFT_195823 [Phanerochaete carnosa HHB-10118-sp]EKM55771.1 hypothetical protein PHACADRAFT_195823 [Phanerochaete carnosa HHB-10118-sp]